MIGLVSSLLLAAGAAAAAPAAGIDCIVNSRITAQRLVAPHSIFFKVGSRWYRNDLADACPTLRSDTAIATRSTTSQLCAGELVTIFEPSNSIPRGSCPLSRFVEAPDPRRR